MSKFVPASTAAKALGVRPDTLRAWAKAGKIPHYVSPGGRYYYALYQNIAPVEGQPATNEPVAEAKPEPDLVQTDAVESEPVSNGAEPGSPVTNRAWRMRVCLKTVVSGIAGFALLLAITYALARFDRAPERPVPVTPVETRAEQVSPIETRQTRPVKVTAPRQTTKPRQEPCGYWREWC